MDDFPVCPACGNDFEPHKSIGILGFKHWLQCRLCGWLWSVKVDKAEPIRWEE